MNKIDYLPIIKGLIREALKVAKQQPTNAPTTSKVFTMAKISTKLTSIRSKGLGIDLPSSDFRELKMTIAEVEQNMTDSIGQMNRANSPDERARIEQRVIQLKIQLKKLNETLYLAQIAESQKWVKGPNALPRKLGDLI